MSTRSTSRFKRAVLPLGVVAVMTLSACGGGTSSDDSSGSDTDASAFGINVDDCEDPAGVSEPITGTFDIGYSLPLSGPVAGPVELSTAGFDARVAAANEASEVEGIEIVVNYKDDGFAPDKAKANGTEFIQNDGVDAMSTFGTGALSAMVDDQNAGCVPMLYPNASTADFTDIESFPWTTTLLPLAINEAKFLVSLIQERFPDGAKVGIAENPSASGKTQGDAFQEVADEMGLPVDLVVSDGDPVAAATEMKAEGIEVIYHGGVTGTCAAFDSARGRIGYEPELVLKPSNCANAVEYLAAGDAADGVELGAFGKDPSAAESEGDEGVALYEEQMDAAGVPAEIQGNAITVAGWTQADLFVNTLKQAQDSGELTRLSVMEAARDQDYASPMLINGVKWLSTPDVLTGVDGFRPITWVAADKEFVPAGDIVNIRP